MLLKFWAAGMLGGTSALSGPVYQLLKHKQERLHNHCSFWFMSLCVPFGLFLMPKR